MEYEGFIDLHVHGFGRYDTRTDNPDAILKLARLCGKAGTVAFLPTIYAGPVNAMRSQMESVRKAMEIQDSQCTIQDKKWRIKKEPLKGFQQVKRASYIQNHESCILGVHLEGPFLNPSRSGALDGDSFIKPSVSHLKRLIGGYEEIVRIITIAPEIPGALSVIERCRELGIKVNLGHSDATCREAQEGKRAGATGITHIFNAMRPFHHREPGLAGFGLMDDDMYIEVIADGIHLHPETLKLIFRIKRNERIVLVSDSVKGAGGKGKPVYKKRAVLAGSCKAVADAAKILKKAGISDAVILGAGIDNPTTYLYH